MRPDLVRVATVGAAHGLRGEVRLQVHTDDPTGRLVAGAVFTTEPASAGPLTLQAVSTRSGATYVRFSGYRDRTAVEVLRSVVLLGDRAEEVDTDSWYPDQLVGLQARRTDGTPIGAIAGVQHLPAQDVLVLLEPDGTRTQVPFVTQIVPTVDLAAGVVVIDAPHGLLAADAEPEEPGTAEREQDLS